MAIIKTLTTEEQATWDAWGAKLPASTADLARRFPPTRLYRLQSRDRCTIYSYSEHGTMTVAVTGEFNRIMFARRVFDIKPEDLVETDLPGPDEELGEVLKSQEEVDAYIAQLRAEAISERGDSTVH